MAEENTDNFVEIEGAKYQKDPDNEGEALLGEDGKFVPFKEEEKKEPEKKEIKEEDEEPKVRKSAKDYIIERKQKKIDKLEDKKDDNNFGSDEDLTPEGKKAIEKGIEEANAPLKKMAVDIRDEQELTDLFAKHPEAREKEKMIRKYMKVYQNAPVEFIYLAMAGKKMILDKKRQEADDKAKKNKAGGHSRRKMTEGELPDFKGMSDKEFDKYDRNFQTGQR